jgi:hypothetical protein
MGMINFQVKVGWQESQLNTGNKACSGNDFPRSNHNTGTQDSTRF